MSRHTGPVCRSCRREGLKIYLKSDRCFTDKCSFERNQNPPGQHGQRRMRVSDYGQQLREKQKVKRIYGILEKQFRRYYAEASRRKGNTGELLLQLLEERLDNILRRSGFVRTIWSARQTVVHGHVLVNGKKADKPGISLKPGDVITFRDKIQNVIRENMESLAGHIVPSWLELNPAELTARVIATPTPDQIPFDVNTNLIVEFYR